MGVRKDRTGITERKNAFIFVFLRHFVPGALYCFIAVLLSFYAMQQDSNAVFYQDFSIQRVKDLYHMFKSVIAGSWFASGH